MRRKIFSATDACEAGGMRNLGPHQVRTAACIHRVTTKNIKHVTQTMASPYTKHCISHVDCEMNYAFYINMVPQS